MENQTYSLKEKLKNDWIQEGYNRGRLKCLEQHYGKELDVWKTELRKKIEDKKINAGGTPMIEGYNQAIQDIIDLLK
mgnify:CR=1 FL=1